MTQALQLTIKLSILDRPRQLTIDEDYIEFDNSDVASDGATKFYKADINGLRHGVRWINGYQFTIGRIYCIDIRSKSDQIIKIRLKTMYGIRKEELTNKYGLILNALYEYYFDDISREYLQQFVETKEFQIAGFRFDQAGIALSEKSEVIPWNDVGTRAYERYYSIFSLSNPENYRISEYLDDWNCGVLYSVSRGILKEKGLWSG